MSTTPIFTATPRAAIKQISSGNTNRDGSGTLVDIMSAGSSGTRIERVEITARGVTTAGVVRLFLNDGTTSFLIRELLVTAITPSTSVAVFSVQVSFTSASQMLLLPSGYTLQASTHNAEAFNVSAFGGDF